MGLIDTLSSGFKTVQRRPWLVLLPVLLDLWLWLGPHWSIQPLTDGVLRLLAAGSLPPELEQSAEAYRQLLQAAGANFNLWWLIDNNPTWLRTALPGLSDAARIGGASGLIETSTPAIVLWSPLLLLAGIGLGSVFMVSIVSQISPERTDAPGTDGAAQLETRPFGYWLRRTLRTFSLVTLFSLLLLALLLMTSLLLSIALTPLFLISAQAGVGATSIAALLIGWLAVVFYMMFYFVVAAIASDGVGLRQAMWRSFNVVYRNFWSTLGLLILVTLILWGFGLIWQRLATASPVGALAAIVGNGVLITGLTAARLLFYQDRSARWLAALAVEEGATPPAGS